MTERAYPSDLPMLGCCYYPEQWDRGLWEDDIRRMAELGFRAVRMGESAWSIMEPEEDRFDFSLFDEVIAYCTAYGLKVVMGTPTYAPPAWLTSKYPEVLRVDFWGHRQTHGSRRHYNYTSPIYLHRCEEIVRRLAEHYAGHPQVIGWQIDNELNCHSNTSFAPSDCEAFRSWCRSKYNTLDALNEAWGTVFWSQTYTDWAQIEPPGPTPTYHNPGHLLDFFRFTSDTAIQFAELQYRLIKQAAPHQFVTHNGMFTHIDYEALTDRALDFVSYDSYPSFQLLRKELPAHFRDRLTGKHLSKARGISAKFMILEQQAGPGGQNGSVLSKHPFGDYLLPTPKEGQMRLWVWQSMAHGADAVFFFRWRTALFGAETLWHGLNDYGNRPNRRLEEAGRIAREVNAAGSLLTGTRCVAHAAILYDFDNDTNGHIEGYLGAEEWKMEEHIYRSLSERHLLVDLLPRGRWLSQLTPDQYPVAFYANAMLMDAEDSKCLQSYVEQGGTLIVGPRSGYKDRRNRCHMLPFPGMLQEWTGIEIEEFTKVYEHLEPSELVYAHSQRKLPAPVFREVLRSLVPDAEILATYAGSTDEGQPAVIRVRLGRGQLVYAGTFMTTEHVSELLDVLGVDDPTAVWAAIPPEIEVIRRLHTSEDSGFYILLNYTNQPVILTVKQPVSDAVTGKRIQEGTGLELKLDPYDVRFVRVEQEELRTFFPLYEKREPNL